MQIRLHVVTNVQSTKNSMWTMQKVTDLMQAGSSNTARNFFMPYVWLQSVFSLCCVFPRFSPFRYCRLVGKTRTVRTCSYFVASWTRRPIDVSSPLLIISNSFSWYLFFCVDTRSPCSRLGRFVLNRVWSQGGFPVCFCFSYPVVFICDYRFAVFTVVECKWISFQMYLPMHRHHRRRV